MEQLFVSPENPPAGLVDLYGLVAEEIGAKTVAPLVRSQLPETSQDAPALVLVDGSDQGLDVVRALADRADRDLAVVVADGYLGTDGAGLDAAASGAAAISLVRSMAVRQGAACRANAVVVPEALFGTPGSQRGPLRLDVNEIDVASAVGFLLGRAGGYLSGQVLYANGGRQLFSSLTS